MLLRQMTRAGGGGGGEGGGGGGGDARGGGGSAPPDLAATSLLLAKEALALNVADPASWACLGNALLAAFFAGSRDPAAMDNAAKAFSRAVALEDAAVAAAEREAAAARAAGGGGDGDGDDGCSSQRAASPYRNPDLHMNRAGERAACVCVVWCA